MLRAFALRTLAPRLLPARGGAAGAAAFHSATKNSLAQMLEVERFFQLLDTDKDGSVSKEEAVRYYMATGMPEEEALAIFRAADANNDGAWSGGALDSAARPPRVPWR